MDNFHDQAQNYFLDMSRTKSSMTQHPPLHYKFQMDYKDHDNDDEISVRERAADEMRKMYKPRHADYYKQSSKSKKHDHSTPWSGMVSPWEHKYKKSDDCDKDSWMKQHDYPTKKTCHKKHDGSMSCRTKYHKTIPLWLILLIVAGIILLLLIIISLAHKHHHHHSDSKKMETTRTVTRSSTMPEVENYYW